MSGRNAVLAQLARAWARVFIGARPELRELEVPHRVALVELLGAFQLDVIAGDRVRAPSWWVEAFLRDRGLTFDHLMFWHRVGAIAVEHIGAEVEIELHQAPGPGEIVAWRARHGDGVATVRGLH